MALGRFAFAHEAKTQRTYETRNCDFDTHISEFGVRSIKMSPSSPIHITEGTGDRWCGDGIERVRQAARAATLQSSIYYPVSRLTPSAGRA